MTSFAYRCFSAIVLLLLHTLNFHLCNRFLRPTLLPLLFTTNETRLIKSINNNLKILSIDYQISLEDIIKNIKFSNNNLNQYNLISENDYSIFSISTFDTLTSLSLQLIELFIIDILNVIDFEFRHFDWYITLSILIIFLTYITPSCILYNLIISDNFENSKNNNKFKNIINFIGIFLIWCLFLGVLYMVAINKEVSGNFLQLSLYTLSLFGVSCLSILNGLGCITGCHDFWDWYYGNEEIKLKKLELELSYELKTLDVLLSSSLSSKETKIYDMIWEQLIKIDSISRDASLIKQNRQGINSFAKFSVWLYCIYKTFYGLLNTIKIVFDELGIFQFLIDYENNGKEKISKNYTGNGDILSNIIAKIILVYIYTDQNIRSFSTFDEIVEKNDEILDMITIIVNVIISFIFFSFSFQNVLLTFKNFKKLSRKLVKLNEFEVFHKLKSVLKQSKNLNSIVISKTLLNELTYLFVSEITGIYVVSTALLLNSINMPIHLSKLIMDIDQWNSLKESTIKSYINPDFMNDWFDRWFSVGCIGTILTIIILDQVEFESSRLSNFDEEELI